MLPKRWGKRLKLHESVQRSLCRLTFLCLGTAPAIGILVFWIVSMTPWWRESTKKIWEERLSLVLGVSVKIERAELTGPSQYRLGGIELKHAETDESLGKLQQCNVRWRSGECSVSSDVGQIDLRYLRLLLDRLHERLLCQPNLLVPKLSCRIGRLDFIQDGFEVESAGLEAVAHCSAKQSLAWAVLRSLENPLTQRNLEVVRSHAANVPTTHAILVTGDQELPSTTMIALTPIASHLGPNATFQGKLEWWNSDIQDSVWKLTGVFNHVSLSNMTASMDYHCTGAGRIYIQDALVANGQLQSASGSLVSDSGKMNREWLELAQAKMGVVVVPRALQTTAAMVPFASIQLAFQLDSDGLMFQGRNPAPQPNYGPSVIADDWDGIVYAQQPAARVPIDQLLDWLTASPISEEQSAVKYAGHVGNLVSSNYIETTRWFQRVLPIQRVAAPHEASTISGSNSTIQR